MQMSLRFVIGCLVLVGNNAESQTATSDGSVASLDAVVVSGEQPGPQLWKLTHNEHVLWVLATVTPKPRDITWRSQQVANVLDSTQEVIDQQLQATTWPANISIEMDSFNPIAGLRASRRAAKLRAANKPPPLAEVLPPEVYARFAKLKARYLPKDSTIESQRPRVAADRLYNAAIEAAGLSSRAMIHDEVHRLARQRHIKVSEVTLTFKFDIDTRVLVESEFNQIAPAAEISCLTDTIEQLESDIPTITARANAWASGDVGALRQLPTMRRELCDAVYWSAPRWSQLNTQLETLWLDTVEAAVKKNKSTLVMLDMAELLQSDGLLAKLAARGYQVEGP
jgi:uncharacterized protein YbaP (TraB family)